MAVLGGMNTNMGVTSALSYENPAFQIKIVAPNDKMQQKQSSPRNNASTSAGDNLREGQPVTAHIGEEDIVGTIYSLKRNGEGDVIYVEVKDREGSIHKVDVSHVNQVNAFDDDVPSNMAGAVSSPGVFAESSRFKSFSEFSKI